MSLAEQMRTAIEQYADELNRTSPLVNKKLKPEAMALYLESLRYLFRYTERNLGWAASESSRLGLSATAQYFEQKTREEHGHEQWAEDDLSKFPEGTVRPAPANAIVELVAFQNRLVTAHPLLFAAYVQWAEYFSVYIGDTWLDQLAEKGYGRDRVTAIDKHLVTDRGHSAVGFAELDGLVAGHFPASAMLAVVRDAGQIFAGILHEMAAA